MNNNNVVPTSIEYLPRQTLEQLQAQPVTAVVISLGSNHQAEQHLATVCKSLNELGDIKLSTAFVNPDITATVDQPKADYINQCAYLSLTSSMALQELKQLFKQFENDCDRQRQVAKTAIKQVTMDIDILLVKLELNKNSLSIYDDNNWIIIKERYPFKAHEIVGIAELAINIF